MHEAGQARVNMKGRSFMYEEKREKGGRASILNSPQLVKLPAGGESGRDPGVNKGANAKYPTVKQPGYDIRPY